MLISVFSLNRMFYEKRFTTNNVRLYNHGNGENMENNKIQNELTERLAVLLPQIRKAYGVSQSRLGSLVGKSRQHISKVERGLAPLRWDTCLAIIFLACKKDQNKLVKVAGQEYLNKFGSFINFGK